jgi:hypothetical protein
VGRLAEECEFRPHLASGVPNKALQPTAATVFALPGLEVSEVAAAAELERSAWKAQQPSMIKTRYKSKLPKTLSWPVGAEAVSAALADAPHVNDLTLSFSDSPVWPASSFQKLLRESLPYAILAAEYWPASKPGYGGSNKMIEGGGYDAKWELRVNPVTRELRAKAGIALRERGLPLIKEWLRSSSRTGWELMYHCMELVFSPLDNTLTPVSSERM